NDFSNHQAISPDGRYGAFMSPATNLVAGDTNSAIDVFRKDLETGETLRVSTSSAGAQAAGDSFNPAFSSDGRYLVFESTASDLVAGDTNAATDIFRKDLTTGETQRCSTNAAGAQAAAGGESGVLSSDGRYVLFESNSADLVAGDSNLAVDVFRKDVVTGDIIRCSTDSSGAQVLLGGFWPDMSWDGRFVAFVSLAGDLVTGDTNLAQDVFRKELAAPAGFYFAEGTCRPGFDPYITIQNAASSPADVLITYMKGDATTVTQQVPVPANSRQTVWVKGLLGEGADVAYDFSARVENLTPAAAIICERPMYFNYNGWDGGSCVVGATAPATTFYFAEGTCRPGFDAYITIQNPSGLAAEVLITYMKGDGSSSTQAVDVAGNSRQTVWVKAALGEGADAAHDFSAKVESLTPGASIICERPMYFDYGGWTGGSCVVGATGASTTWYFAEGTCRPGFDPYITIQNPTATPGQVTITYMLGDATTATQTVGIAAAKRETVRVRDVLGQGSDVAFDFSAKVESLTPGMDIICERPMYFDYAGWTGGSCVVGARAPGTVWFFAEGTCRPGFDPYITIQNPNATVAQVLIVYMKGDATTVTETLSVAANARRTVRVKDTLGEGTSAAYDFSAAVGNTVAGGIICERPMYFSYGRWTGGSCVIGFTP
ncbi:MAG: TolB family protein, partial [Candidatus Geothermincolia bacterium]